MSMWGADWIFIHIPRTGGTFLTDTFGSLPWVSKDVHTYKHASASTLLGILGHEHWERSQKFYVYRPELEIAQSWYHHVQISFDLIDRTNSSSAVPEWLDYIEEMHGLTFEEFALQAGFPKIENQIDLPGIQALTLQQAFDRLVDLTRFIPQEQPREFTSYEV
jgi:hypothetical protein